MLHSAWNSFKKAGVRRSLQRVAQRMVPAAVFDTNSFVAVEYILDEWRNIQTDEKWRHRWATAQECSQLKFGGLTDREIEAYRDRNARAHIIVKDNETVAYAWVIQESWDVFGWAQIRCAPGEIYSAGAYVAVAHRGRRLQGELRKFGWSQLADEGYERAVTFVEMLNRSSLRSQVKPARRYIGRLWYIRILGLVIYSIDGKWGAGFWNKDRPFELSFDMFDRAAPSRPPKGAAT